MVDTLTYGLIGMALIVVAWAPIVYRTIETRESRMDPRFEALYLAGSLFLIVYAINLGDWIFATLNALAAIGAGVGLYFFLTHWHHGRPRSKL
ncbi:MAG TPA: hypothetical protein VGQ00_00435 [Candidatus Norongarragalinales archaeon]|jgi:hypothetical protein|nr:hypothetical protein [Candidatus Norongarragalinales archaeon]